jgi:hypothetical protein
LWPKIEAHCSPALGNIGFPDHHGILRVANHNAGLFRRLEGSRHAVEPLATTPVQSDLKMDPVVLPDNLALFRGGFDRILTAHEESMRRQPHHVDSLV